MVDECDAAEAIEQLLLEERSFAVGELSRRTGLSRQALHRHLSRRVAGGSLIREGGGRGTRYRRADRSRFERTFRLAGLDEVRVWEDLEEWLKETGEPLPGAADDGLAHMSTEMLNNAIDHSRGVDVHVVCERTSTRIELMIADTGVGAFENLREALELEDHFDALIELSKGKVTTQPEEHTGEGIFFTSRMATVFELCANGLRWLVDNETPDQGVFAIESAPGTTVRIELDPAAAVDPSEVFARYTHGFEFDTTRCSIRLLDYGVRFISRSEAKRLVRGLERFREVRLDFTGVQGVGQGFVDEVFRVWAHKHPEVRLVPLEMNEVVSFMVRRGLPKR